MRRVSGSLAAVALLLAVLAVVLASADNASACRPMRGSADGAAACEQLHKQRQETDLPRYQGEQRDTRPEPPKAPTPTAGPGDLAVTG